MVLVFSVKRGLNYIGTTEFDSYHFWFALLTCIKEHCFINIDCPKKNRGKGLKVLMSANLLEELIFVEDSVTQCLHFGGISDHSSLTTTRCPHQ